MCRCKFLDQVQFTVANATCGGQYKVAMTPGRIFANAFVRTSGLVRLSLFASLLRTTVTTIGEGPFSTALDVTNARQESFQDGCSERPEN